MASPHLPCPRERLVGDGLLVYFGYPHAHEDEAQRAVQASLELVETMAPLNTRLEPQYGVRVAVRIGLHTGLVVIGEMGGGNRQEQLAMQGRGEEGISMIRKGVAAWRATGAGLTISWFCILLAEASAHLGHLEDGLQALADAHTLVEQHEERWWEAEIHRLRGVLLLRQPGTLQAEAEAWLQRALDVARHQEAKSLELRAAMSLARLWQQQGKQAEAHALLAPVYDWFTEGFDTADLQDARALLQELNSKS